MAEVVPTMGQKRKTVFAKAIATKKPDEEQNKRGAEYALVLQIVISVIGKIILWF